MNPSKKLETELIDALINEPKTEVIILSDTYRSGNFYLIPLLRKINPRWILYETDYSAKFEKGALISVRSLSDFFETTKSITMTHLLIDYYVAQPVMMPFIKHVKESQDHTKILVFRDQELIDPSTFDIGWMDNPV